MQWEETEKAEILTRFEGVLRGGCLFFFFIIISSSSIILGLVFCLFICFEPRV